MKKLERQKLLKINNFDKLDGLGFIREMKDINLNKLYSVAMQLETDKDSSLSGNLYGVWIRIIGLEMKASAYKSKNEWPNRLYIPRGDTLEMRHMLLPNGAPIQEAKLLYAFINASNRFILRIVEVGAGSSGEVLTDHTIKRIHIESLNMFMQYLHSVIIRYANTLDTYYEKLKPVVSIPMGSTAAAADITAARPQYDLGGDPYKSVSNPYSPKEHDLIKLWKSTKN